MLLGLTDKLSEIRKPSGYPEGNLTNQCEKLTPVLFRLRVQTMKNLITLLVIVVASQFSHATADEGIVFIDQWRKKSSESSTEFIFKKDGTFYVYEVTQIKVFGETKCFRSHLKGTWKSKDDPTRLTANASGVTHLIASDTGNSTFDRRKEYEFLIENKRFFVVVDGKPQRELLKSPNSSDSVSQKVSRSLK